MRELRQDFDEFGRWLHDPATNTFEPADDLSEDDLVKAAEAGKRVVATDEKIRLEAQLQPGSGETSGLP